MCGIIARAGQTNCLPELLTGLSNLEYRGYDSAGIAVSLPDEDRLRIVKSEENIRELRSRTKTSLGSPLGIGHTRWSTHGPPTELNAHPHTGETNSVAVVHNGIIENHASLRDSLEARGHQFTSDTDTEVVPHLVEEYRSRGVETEVAFRRAVSELSGSYAIAMVTEADDTVYATRSGSPLVLGVDDGRYFLASDIPAFLEFTDEIVYLDDGQFVTMTSTGYRILDSEGETVTPPVQQAEWSPEEVGKGEYRHYMRKEIDEQPSALRQTIRGRVDSETNAVRLESFPPGAFDAVDTVQLVACGTSFHAARFGVELLRQRDVPAKAFLASEYVCGQPVTDGNTLVIAVTQSGETADTLAALRQARSAGMRTLALTNVVGSTATRESDETLLIRAGPEIGVAATKTFTSQVASLALLAERLASDGSETRASDQRVLEGLSTLPAATESVLNSSTAPDIAKRYADAEAHFFVGRGMAYSVALEGALKFKEITYEHAEAFAAGELKHGPLALVTEQTPVVAVHSGVHTNRLRSNLQEVKSRGAPVVVATDQPSSVDDIADQTLTVPESHPTVTNLLANVQLQLLSYHAARLRGRPIDRPRNLAKSVTVE